MLVFVNQPELLLPVEGPKWLKLTDGCSYLPDYIPADQSGTLLEQLRDELSWQQQTIQLFGKPVMQPRLICWQADPDVDYGYSGIRLVPGTWHPRLRELRQRLLNQLGLEFNSVLVNAYRDGQDSMGWHADNEPELGPEPTLASISLGAERVFRWRRKGSGRSEGIRLRDGSLLLLEGLFQKKYQHSVPKTRTITDLRINLTFRRVLNPGGN
ncbi:MAG TPA: alpha-ketoglutarate-dependent dioxygenase AlkB [Xanthomonadales bacterium]|nr:alpha-ketoglutarate-dependent dioxygenase AlkB [Xanthomonadales bacterium]